MIERTKSEVCKQAAKLFLRSFLVVGIVVLWAGVLQKILEYFLVKFSASFSISVLEIILVYSLLISPFLLMFLSLILIFRKVETNDS